MKTDQGHAFCPFADQPCEITLSNNNQGCLTFNNVPRTKLTGWSIELVLIQDR